MSDTDKFVVCAGCGKQIRDDWMHRALIEGYRGHDVPVCARADRTNPTPSAACARKARTKQHVCPGCGEPLPFRRVICTECSRKLARDEVSAGKSVRWYSISYHIVGPYVGGGSKAQQAATVLLAKIAAGGRRWGESASAYDDCSPMCIGDDGHGHSGMAVVEMDEEQAAALSQLGTLLAATMKAQHDAGFHEGDNLLRRLSSGDVKPNDYEQWGPKRGEGR